jgi:ParB-like chromosome segregation protein Spo0J
MKETKPKRPIPARTALMEPGEVDKEILPPIKVGDTPAEARAAIRETATERINEALVSLVVEIDTLTLDPQNARAHGQRNLDAIAFSLKTFGQQAPVVATSKGVVVKGNGMVMAARALGWTRIAAVRYPSEDVNEVRAFAIADNRTGELSEWNYEQLGESLRLLRETGVPVVDLGWSEAELDLLMIGVWKPRPGAEEEIDADPGRGESIMLTKAQREIFDLAVEKMRVQEGDAKMSEGRIVELLSAEFIS